MHNYADLGEKEPGATLGQKARARGIAASIREGRSSVGGESHPVEMDLHGDVAAPKSETFGTNQKDLGRVTAKYARGDTPAGEQPELLQAAKKRAIAGKSIAGSEEEVAASSAGKMSLSKSLKAKFGGLAKGVGETLGIFGAASQAVQGVKAYQGLKEGKVLDPVSLEPRELEKGEEYHNILTGKKTKNNPGNPGYRISS